MHTVTKAFISGAFGPFIPNWNGAVYVVKTLPTGYSDPKGSVFLVHRLPLAKKQCFFGLVPKANSTPLQTKKCAVGS